MILGSGGAKVPPKTDDALIAAAKNAAWHHAVFTAHGRHSTPGNGIWVSRSPAPRFFSNVVTTSPHPVESQLAAIDDLVASLRDDFAVKDSFGTLDLASRGFRVLFNAEWIRSDHAPDADSSGWVRTTHADELGAWEAALHPHAEGARAFPAKLLADPDVAIFALRRSGRIVAGAAANRSGDAVGFSNVFAEPDTADGAYAAAAALAAGFAPGLPIIGYESDADLDRALRLGFRSGGPLRVWARDA